MALQHQKGISMKKWEFIEVTAPMRDDAQSVRIYLNGEEVIPESKSSALYEYLNKLGQDGWEMVSFAFYPNKTAFYYFKRAVK
jgi:hypothetical protein